MLTARDDADSDEADRRELRASARGFFEKYSDEDAVRATMETAEGFDLML
jgi:hypothetical protein